MHTLQKQKRIIIKIGSSLLIGAKGSLQQEWLKSLIADASRLIKDGKEIVIVSSGSIGLGRHILGSPPGQPLKLEEKQAAAACGQVLLMQAYQKFFAKHKRGVAQVLLTLEDSEDRRRYLNARATFRTLLDAGIVPVVNENDTVATEEIRVGDNDRLAARVAQMVEAETLILFSDIDGLYEKDPRSFKDAKHIPTVTQINTVIEAMAGSVGSVYGSGGMATKIAAAKIATASGCHTIVTRGDVLSPVKALQKGGKHTVFLAAKSPQNARKEWIAHTLGTRGKIVIDEGAMQALKNGKSLLPAGVRQIYGEFQRGDVVEIIGLSAKPFAKGISAYSSEDMARIKGLKTAEIEKVLGFKGRAELVHRDDFVLLER